MIVFRDRGRQRTETFWTFAEAREGKRTRGSPVARGEFRRCLASRCAPSRSNGSTGIRAPAGAASATRRARNTGRCCTSTRCASLPAADAARRDRPAPGGGLHRLARAAAQPLRGHAGRLVRAQRVQAAVSVPGDGQARGPDQAQPGGRGDAAAPPAGRAGRRGPPAAVPGRHDGARRRLVHSDHRLMFALLAATGVRRSELLALEGHATWTGGAPT